MVGLQPSPVDQELHLLLGVQEVRQPPAHWVLVPLRFQEGLEVQGDQEGLEHPDTAMMKRVRSGRSEGDALNTSGELELTLIFSRSTNPEPSMSKNV